MILQTRGIVVCKVIGKFGKMEREKFVAFAGMTTRRKGRNQKGMKRRMEPHA
jgi:hypothetical protein